MTKDEARRQGLLTRQDMIKGMGMSESSFDRLGLEPAQRVGKHSYYSVRQVLAAQLAKEIRAGNPWMCSAAAAVQAESRIG